MTPSVLSDEYVVKISSKVKTKKIKFCTQNSGFLFKIDKIAKSYQGLKSKLLDYGLKINEIDRQIDRQINKKFFTGLFILVGRVFANGPGKRASIPGQIIPNTKKLYLMQPCLEIRIIRYESRVQRSNPGGRSRTLPYRGVVVVNESGAFELPSITVTNFFFIYIYIYIGDERERGGEGMREREMNKEREREKERDRNMKTEREAE